jgi:hypothetical protein
MLGFHLLLGRQHLRRAVHVRGKRLVRRVDPHVRIGDYVHNRHVSGDSHMSFDDMFRNADMLGSIDLSGRVHLLRQCDV